MHTNSADASSASHPDFAHLRRLHAQAVRDSVALIRRVTPDDLSRPTPCSAWTLAELLAHMTAQHHGFAAAALGKGQDLAHWSVRPLGTDPVGLYTAAAEHVIAAFATVEGPDRAFALPEFSTTRTFRAVRAIGFHLIDYVVHSWDVARALGLAYTPDTELLRAALPIARAVPDDDSRLAPGSAFRPGLATDEDADTLERILAALGRSPRWRGPEDGTATRDTRS
ncbi:TIGR03086 family metal-binding protein [Streptomyces libani]|uniref:TIGR03086 family metal-binding protein n=1 Tax=Streptomyces nigrescens TaxID=1920 RepID=A0A640T8X1_STRNI|nr:MULTISPECIES: TIGR03086 family metal-binding protein [Streptomyces]WAT95029.1 TIGR03086 family metal-binding protein [Streptomyces libani subsp. libani]WDT59374.1 TIGR03086 family metal-binding protein [Streptomyces sp. G7(2002)]GFE20193.1 TIGR03086 family protein [Streptomyces libani subsp. libani]GGV86133.1 TIGR03086 family protein [Streptomyces libani subsp. libani]